MVEYDIVSRQSTPRSIDEAAPWTQHLPLFPLIFFSIKLGHFITFYILIILFLWLQCVLFQWVLATVTSLVPHRSKLPLTWNFPTSLNVKPLESRCHGHQGNVYIWIVVKKGLVNKKSIKNVLVVNRIELEGKTKCCCILKTLQSMSNIKPSSLVLLME